MDIDLTYLIQLGLLLLSLVTLNGIILKPFLRVIQQREALTVGAQADVENLRVQAARDRAEYQRRMREAQRDADTAREALREEGREEERKILNSARADVVEKLSAARREVAQAEKEAQAKLVAEAQDMSRALVSKILDREVAV